MGAFLDKTKIKKAVLLIALLLLLSAVPFLAGLFDGNVQITRNISLSLFNYSVPGGVWLKVLPPQTVHNITLWNSTDPIPNTIQFYTVDGMPIRFQASSNKTLSNLSHSGDTWTFNSSGVDGDLYIMAKVQALENYQLKVDGVRTQVDLSSNRWVNFSHSDWNNEPYLFEISPINITSNTPIITGISTGNFYINWTYTGDENTDDFEVMIDDINVDHSINTYYNGTYYPHATKTISIRAHNHSTGIYSDWVNQTTTIPNNPIHITDIQNFYNIIIGETLIIDANYSDEDYTDIGVFDRDFTNGTFDNATGLLSWFTNSSDEGEPNLTITVNDNNGSISEKMFTVTIFNISYLAITDHSPSSPDPVSDITMNQTFSINLSREADVTWYINSSLVLNESNVSFSSYTNTSPVAGNYMVLASAADGNMTINQTWNWTVIPSTNNSPVIISWGNNKTNNRSLTLTTLPSENVSFNITIDQTVDVIWYLNGSVMVTNRNVTVANYTNTSAVEGIWNITAIAANTNGSVSKSWTWKVVAAVPAAASTTVAGTSDKSTSGQGVVSSEPSSNILKAESQINTLVANISAIYIFKIPGLVIYEISVTGKEDENDITLRVEILKTISKLVNIDPPGVVYKNLNIWAGTEKIKEALIRFKVENSWLRSNSFEGSHVTFVKWDGSKWITIETRELRTDNYYNYYEAKTDSFGLFAITGLKGEVNQTVEVTTPVNPKKPATTPAPTMKKVPEFDFELAAVILCITYLFIRRRRSK